MSVLNFWGSEVKKVKFGSAEKMGCECGNVSVSQKETLDKAAQELYSALVLQKKGTLVPSTLIL